MASLNITSFILPVLWIQHFKWIRTRIRIRIRIQDFDDHKLKRIQLKIYFIFFWQKLQFYLSLGLRNGFFSIFVLFLPSWIQIRPGSTTLHTTVLHKTNDSLRWYSTIVTSFYDYCKNFGDGKYISLIILILTPLVENKGELWLPIAH
jgi:hypothetical protein